jgi:hypothetical protein
MEKTRTWYEQRDLAALFAGHVAVREWRSRGEDYGDKLLTLGFQACKRGIPLRDFVGYIGLPELANLEQGSGQVCYLTPNAQYEGWCWVFDVDRGRVTGFGANGYSLRFYQDADGTPRFVHEVLFPIERLDDSI